MVKEGIGAGTYPAQPDITTDYTLDAEGRRLSETTSADGLSQTSTAEYDLVGRATETVDSSGLISETTYANGGRTVTTTLPGGATRITENFKDGRVKSITGTADVAQYYEYGVNANGSQWTKVYTASPSSPMWEKTTTDLAGRVIKVERPGYSGTEVAESFFNNKGQLVKTTTTGLPDTLLV